MFKKLAAIGLMAGALGTSGAASAQWYIGGGAGKSKIDTDNTGIDSTIRSSGFATSTTTSDERDTGYKIFGGYQFHPNFAGEVSYANLGKFSTFTTTTGPAATGVGEIKIDNTWSFDLLGIAPLGNNFSIFGRAGLLYSETKQSATLTGPGGTVSVAFKDNDWNWKLGIGAGYEFTPQFGVRAEWERYRVSDGLGGHGDLDLFSVSARFKF